MGPLSPTVETDGRSRVVLPGRPNERFILVENSDGSILLEPAVTLSRAQVDYNTNPELQRLLTEAAAAPTVRKRRERRPA